MFLNLVTPRFWTSFEWKGNEVAAELSVNRFDLCPNVFWPHVPRWKLLGDHVDLKLLNNKARDKSAYLAQGYYSHTGRNYNGKIQIYTGGSKDLQIGKTGVAIAIPDFQIAFGKRTTDGLSIYAVELAALLTTVEWASEGTANNILICSNSSLTLASINA